MQGKLQELTDKIYQEGIGKAKDDSERIIADAKENAEAILRDARKEADDIRAKADKDAAEMKENVASEIRLAGEQAVSALKQKIREMISNALVDAQVSDAFKDAGFMKKMIEAAVSAWDPSSGSLVLDLPESAKGELDSYVKSGALDKLNKGIEVVYGSGTAGGFRIGPAEGGFLVSFTDEGFVNFFKEYLRPRAAQFLFGE